MTVVRQSKVFRCYPGKKVRSFAPKPMITVAQRMIAEQMQKAQACVRQAQEM